MARRRIKVTSLLVAINILVLLFIIGFYAYRGIHYYLVENSPIEEGATLLVDDLTRQASKINIESGLVYNQESNIYRFKGNVTNNYVLYSGILYRIMLVDNENNIKLVSDETLTLMYSGLEKGFDNSYVNKWLNKSEDEHSGEFVDLLYNNESLLTHTYNCNDVIDDLTKITCDKSKNDNMISLISLYDYSQAGGKESYLNNKETYYLSTVDSKGSVYYVSATGEVGLNSIKTKILGVRPVITISSESVILSGDGNKTTPYVIEEHEIKTLKDLYVGSIVSYSGNLFRVVSFDKEKVKVAAIDYIKDKDNENVSKAFGSNNKYSTSKNTLGNYLNDTYLESLGENSIVASDWYIGSNTLSSLDYSNKYSDKVNAKIGILSLGELYVDELYNSFTLSRGIESNNIIDVINSTGNVFGDLTTKEYNIRPSFYLSNKMPISGGKGSMENPYKISEVSNEKK